MTIDELAKLAGRHPRVIRAAIRMIQRPTARDRRRLEHWRMAVGALEGLDRMDERVSKRNGSERR